MAEPPEFARYGEKCPRTGGAHIIGHSGRCRHCNGKARGGLAVETMNVSIDAWEKLKATPAAPETRNGLTLLPIAVPDGQRVETYFTNTSINGEPQTVSWSKPSDPNTWDAAFTEPQPQSYEAIKGRTSVDVIPPPQPFQQVDAENQRAILANPPRARLTCDRNGLEPGSWDREQELRAASNTVLDAANRHVAKLNERIAVLEADNNAMVAHIQHHKERFRHWRTRALQLAMELALLKMAKPSPAMTLPEPEKPSQDAIWRNATRFSR